MKTRVLVPELMDDPSIGSDEHFLALQGLSRINRWSRNAALAWRPVRDLAICLGRDELRILDVATGGADIPIDLWRRGRAGGLDLVIDACDASPRAIQFAAEHRRQADATLNLLTLDILNEDITDRYDLVMCSQFLHHLTLEQAVLVLAKMAEAAAHRVVAIDLIRSRFNWVQVWLATRVLSRSRVVQFDGPQSVRAAFTRAEVHEIASRIGFAHVDITSHWPCRFVLVGKPNDC